MAPKNTVTNIARPRPRTQSGSATCADTLKLASTHIHDRPASAQAVRPATGSRVWPNSTSAMAVPAVPTATTRSGPSFDRSQGRMNAPATAPAPIVPSMKP
jgi:hypothetical protein